jgi:hypothetical protein
MEENLKGNESMNDVDDPQNQHFGNEHHNVDIADDSAKSIDIDKRISQGLVRRLFMDNRGNIKANSGTMVLAKTTRVYII